MSPNMYYNNTNIIPNNAFLLVNTMDSKDEGCESNILILIMKIQPIFLLIFGFIANLCSFAVLIQPRLRRRSTFSYIAFLSLSNAFLSLIHAFFTIIGVYFRLTLEDLSLFIFCRLLNRFLIDFLTHFSLLTLTAVDFDRCRTITSKTTSQPHFSHIPSIRHRGFQQAFIRVCLIELSFALILFLLDLHWLTSYGYKQQQINFNTTVDITMCTISDTNGYPSFYEKYLTSILPIIELTVFGILPFSISFISSIFILRHLSVKYMKINTSNKHLKQSRRRMELHLSILLILLNFVYIVFTTPHNIFSVYVGRLRHELENKNEREYELCSVAIIQKSLDLLQQCYFMSTFFLYILTNKRFREEFYRLLKCIPSILHRNKNANEHPAQTYRNRSITTIHTNDNRHINHNFLLVQSHGILENSSSISEGFESTEVIPMLNK